MDIVQYPNIDQLFLADNTATLSVAKFSHPYFYFNGTLRAPQNDGIQLISATGYSVDRILDCINKNLTLERTVEWAGMADGIRGDEADFNSMERFLYDNPLILNAEKISDKMIKIYVTPKEGYEDFMSTKLLVEAVAPTFSEGFYKIERQLPSY